MQTKQMLLGAIAVCALACMGSAQEGTWIQQGVPTQLTFGAGNDVEAAVGPDGRIAYENDAGGGLEIFILDPASGNTQKLIGGAPNVMAAYPAWTPDGGIVYALSRPTGTAIIQVPAGGDIGCNLWLWKDGAHTRLTKGLWRDFTPSVSPDGKKVWFTTSRGRRNVGDGSHLACLDLTDPEHKVTEFRNIACSGGQAAVSPVVSPRGKLLLWAQADGAFSNWCLQLSLERNVEKGQQLTKPVMSCYAPRWSPDGRYIAFTGFRKGDDGWGVWIMEPRTGNIAKVETGKGNAKSPCWTPDGKALVYENNATGLYKLYRIDVTLNPPAVSADETEEVPLEPKTTGRLVRQDDGSYAWQDENGKLLNSNELRNNGIAFNSPAGIDFKRNTFFLKGKFKINSLAKGANAAILVAAYYPFNPNPAWQFFVDGNSRFRFSSRTPEGQYTDVVAQQPIKLGVEYDIVATHAPDGHLSMLISGQPRADMQVDPPAELVGAKLLTFGTGINGVNPVDGGLTAFECGVGIPKDFPRIKTLKELFEEEDK